MYYNRIYHFYISIISIYSRGSLKDWNLTSPSLLMPCNPRLHNYQENFSTKIDYIETLAS